MRKFGRFSFRSFWQSNSVSSKYTRQLHDQMAVQSPSVGRNKQFILEVVKERAELLRNNDQSVPLTVLEIAAGTGEHTELFASNLPNCRYLPTEMDVSMHSSIIAWNTSTIESGTVLPPVALDVLDFDRFKSIVPSSFCGSNVDAVININMIHISPWSCTNGLFSIAAAALRPGGILLMYGPFRVNGKMVESNMKFEQWLKGKSPEYGVRDVADVAAVAKLHGLSLSGDPIEMPANNLILLFVMA